jgi:hypothetical protein
MLSPRRSAQLGLVSAFAVLVLSVTILIRGSATAEQRLLPAEQTASQELTPQQLVLGAHTSSLSH